MASLFDNLVIDKQVVVNQENTIEEHGKQYAVIFHNDDITPFEFVIMALIEIFNKNLTEAYTITKKIHDSTKGVVGIYDMETAYEKLDELDKFKDRINKMLVQNGMEARCFLLATVDEVE